MQAGRINVSWRLICVAAALLPWTFGLSAGADSEVVHQQCPAPAAVLAQDTTVPQDYVCCFGGASDEACSKNSPNKGGCEFVMAYRCGAPGYACDDEQGVCKCNAPESTDGAATTTQ